MDRQLAAGLAVRGWLEPAYFLLGSDFTGSSDTGALSYMANMGGWGILDYGMNFASVPWDWLQLGYASYLSSWALMNTGRLDTNYGFWFPGPENDGASGWQFTTAKWARGWIRKEMPRGPWHYDGEIDLGYGGGLRMAATVVADDPLFGLIAYGGTLAERAGRLEVVPRDGLRKRLAIVLPGMEAENDREVHYVDGKGVQVLRRLRLEFERDGFVAGAPIVLDRTLRSVSFTVENASGDAHKTGLRLSLPAGERYELRVGERSIALQPTGNADYPLRAEFEMPANRAAVVLLRR